MSNLKFDGYYLSEPFHYEDWHAGLKIEHFIFTAYFFLNDSTSYKAAKEVKKIFNKADFLNDGMEVEYSIDGETIDFHYGKGSKFEYHRIFLIKNDETIVDEESMFDDGPVTYQWVSFSAEEGENDEKKEDSPSPEIES